MLDFVFLSGNALIYVDWPGKLEEQNPRNNQGFHSTQFSTLLDCTEISNNIHMYIMKNMLFLKRKTTIWL